MSSLSYPPCGILSGDVGVGKTIELARSFHDWFWVTSSPTLLGSYESWLQAANAGELDDLSAEEAAQYSLPKTKYIGRYKDVRTMAIADHLSFIRKFMLQWHSKAKAGKIRHRGLVFSEWTVICDLIFRNIKMKHTGGRGMNFDAIDEIKELNQWMIQIARDCKTGLIFEMHWVNKKFVDKEDAPNFGEVQYPAGPQFPIGTDRRAIGRELDFVWQLCAEEDEATGEVERYFKTQPAEDELRKTRRWKAPPRLPLGLREHLLSAGFVL